MSSNEDLFGNVESKNALLRDKYIEPPFSVLDTKGGNWQKRKKMWSNLGIRSEVGRDAKLWKGTNSSFANEKFGKKKMGTESIFDPVLCEILYLWFLAEFEEVGDNLLFTHVPGLSILDVFAGGSVRGIVAAYLNYKYTGIDIRPEQIESNIEQALKIVPDNMPNWLIGDSNIVLDNLIFEEYDLLFSCPPYADLEVYSDLPGDISNMSYPEFLKMYRSIIIKSCALLKPGGYAVFVVGEVRGKDKNYYGFIPDTIQAFKDGGLDYYNEAILLNAIGTSMLRVGTIFEKGGRKLVKTHQNILCFRKPI